MKKNYSKRNKTIRLTEQERSNYSKELIRLTDFSSNITNKIINQDFYEAIKYLPKEFADLIIIDPPYNLTKTFHDVKFKQLSCIDYTEYITTWLEPVLNCLKPEGSIYICSDWKSSQLIYNVLKEHVTIRNRITWQRERGRGSQYNWKNCLEDIWYGVKSSNYYFDVDAVKQKKKVIAPYKENGKPKDWEETSNGKFRLTYPSNIWTDITIPYWSMPENTEHPTQKPEKLIAKIILASCPENGMVFDPFLGSGTTAVVAKKLNRNFCGIELSTEYALLSIKRLHMADINNSIQGYEGGVFIERNASYKR